MAKKGVYKITGNTHPKTGEKTVYQVTEWYPDTPNSKRRDTLVTWELFKKNDKGQFITTHIKKKGIGEFTFGKQSYQSTFMVEGYLHSPERKEPMAIIVHPQKNDGPTSKERDIIGVKLTYQDGSNITKALSYMDRLRATVKCQNLEGQHLTLSLWEDDEKHEGHNKKNQFIIKSPPIEVDSRGYARWNFTLLNTYISLANKREDDKKQHEYYILAEYNGKLQASDNVNVNNPEYKVPSKAPQPAPAKKPQPKPDTPKGSTHQGSSNNQPDKKGIIKKITLVDKDGKPFKRRPTFGQTIKLIIEAQDVVGKKYNLKLWEHDSWGGDDLLYNNTHTFKANRQEVLIPLTHEMQTIGEIGIDPKNPNYGEYWTGNWQEIYAEVTLLYISTRSPIINVDIEEKTKVLDNGRSVWKKEKSEVMKASSTCICQEQYKDLIWGAKVSCEFRKKVVEICKDLWGEENKMKMANNLMAVFAWESGGTFKPDAPNQANSGGTGLIQFMPTTAKTLLGKEITIETVKNYYGKKYNKETKKKEDWNLKRIKEFADMTAIQQLDYVKKHFEPLRGKNVEFIDFYLQVLFPASSGLPEHVVFADSLQKLDRPFESEELRKKRVSAYANNKGMDIIKDGKLMKSEIKTSVQKYITEGLQYRKIEKCENETENKPSNITGKCTEGNVVDGFIENHLITKNKIESCNKSSMPRKTEIIVLHRTAGGKASGTLNHMEKAGYGAHFVIDYDGTVYQTIDLNKKGSHMGVAQFQSTKNAGWGNNNSIGIETSGYSFDKDGNKRIGPKYDKIPHHHWEPVTDAQAKSVACLLKFLLNNFNLTIDNVKVHEKLCSKEPKEGQDVYDAMLAYFNTK